MLNEINFLRKLSACENIVTLERVYFEENAFKRERYFMLMMKFAKYGTLLNIIENKYSDLLSEDQVRNIMA